MARAEYRAFEESCRQKWATMDATSKQPFEDQAVVARVNHSLEKSSSETSSLVHHVPWRAGDAHFPVSECVLEDYIRTSEAPTIARQREELTNAFRHEFDPEITTATCQANSVVREATDAFAHDMPRLECSALHFGLCVSRDSEIFAQAMMIAGSLHGLTAAIKTPSGEKGEELGTLLCVSSQRCSLIS